MSYGYEEKARDAAGEGLNKAQMHGVLRYIEIAPLANLGQDSARTIMKSELRR